jgi:hypothetical protein
MLDESVAATCFFRGMELLEGEPESSEHALAMWMLSFTQLASGDVDGARASLQEARAIARRVVSPGMEAMAVQGLAHIAVTEGGRAEVLLLVDEAAALAMRPGVEPIHAGYVYCAVISIYRALCDWGRATEWTNMSTRYCERESIAGYSGLPLPPGGDRSPPRSAGPGGGTGAAGVRGAAGGEPLQRRVGL